LRHRKYEEFYFVATNERIMMLHIQYSVLEKMKLVFVT